VIDFPITGERDPNDDGASFPNSLWQFCSVLPSPPRGEGSGMRGLRLQQGSLYLANKQRNGPKEMSQRDDVHRTQGTLALAAQSQRSACEWHPYLRSHRNHVFAER
jgi:hypothetical protein